MKNCCPEHIALAVTGASGFPYAMRLLECLLKSDVRVSLLISDAARAVAKYESDFDLPTDDQDLQVFLNERLHAKANQLHVYGKMEWTAPIASGSNPADAMVVCPCSMGCVSAIATGASNTLIERVADVMIKEKRPLLVVTREMPLSAIHLENMLKLAHAGATILPASPGFYHKPKRIEDLIDFVVARILDHLSIPNEMPRWS